MNFLDITDNWIKRKIILAMVFKNLNNEIDTKYLRLYRSVANTDNVFIFLLKLGYIEKNGIIEKVVKEVVEPISNTVIYRFRDKKYLSAPSKFDYSTNLGIPGYDMINNNLDSFEFPPKIKIKDIYKLYKNMNEKNKLEKNSKTR